MLICRVLHIALAAVLIDAVEFPSNPVSDISADDSVFKVLSNKTLEQSDEDFNSHGIEVEKSNEDVKDKRFLEDALNTILDPNSIIEKTVDDMDSLKEYLGEIKKKNFTLSRFMEAMDNLSLEFCKKAQNALWVYVTNVNDPFKKKKMMDIANEEDEIKRQYWNILKEKFLINDYAIDSSVQDLERKLRVIKERGTIIQVHQSKQRGEIHEMQGIWSQATVNVYNSTNSKDPTVLTMSDIMSLFKRSENPDELLHYWKGFRDSTGKKIRPIFKDYIARLNEEAIRENFADIGDMWRYSFDDHNFINTVDKIWKEIKPMYNILHEYVKYKLKPYYVNVIGNEAKSIPAHILGNLWAQDWQALYSKIVLNPDHPRTINPLSNINSKYLFDVVNDFYESMGFENAQDAYAEVNDAVITPNCLPSSHDMCDGIVYKIKWCGDKVTDISVGLSRAARLLGHVQYFKSYHSLPLFFRDGPTPAFHDAFVDIIALQVTRPEYINSLKFGNISMTPEMSINHMLWLALEKMPLMGYAYTLDKWRWEIFSNSSLTDWNQYWWDLRLEQTGISPPISRNESDLDPASKYHVVSSIQYITYLISPVLEFQILQSLCKAANHTGPLHECSIYGVKEAGDILRKGMSLGTSVDWRTVLKTMTGDEELSTDGFINYFTALMERIQKENIKLASEEEEDIVAYITAPIIVGAILLFITVTILIIYSSKKHNLFRIFLCGFRRNGSLDLATNDVARRKRNDVIEVVEEGV